jgi:PAS domain S-box-containing protein
MRDRDLVFAEMQMWLHRETDKMFVKLLVGQWLAASVLALVVAPALFLLTLVGGGLATLVPLYLVRTRSGHPLTRHVVAAVQMLWCTLLVAVTTNRIETQFHVFGSLAFLAFYRDWKILPTAVVVRVFAFSRAIWWPESTTGPHLEIWQVLEGAAWITIIGATMAALSVRGFREIKAAAARQARLERTAKIIDRKVQERTVELQENAERYRALVENTEAITFEYDVVAGRMLYIAPQASRLLDCSLEQLGDQTLLANSLHPDDRERVLTTIQQMLSGARSWNDPIDTRLVSRRGRIVHVRTFINARGGSRRVRAIALDVTRQRKLESELQQAQKLESVGRLAAGVAHEINTPTQFIGDSVQFMAQSIEDMMVVVAKQQVLLGAIRAGLPADEVAKAAAQAQQAADDADLAYLMEQAPKAAARALDGVERVGSIVRSMKVFAHPDSAEMEPVDLNTAVKSTLTIARNEYRYVANLDIELGEIPPVTCFVGEINQVILNVVINAAHAIADIHAQTGTRGKITVKTSATGDHVEIAIRDTGGGIPEHVRERIYDPFFTTKDVGMGSGQGLAIARSVIVDKHHGELTFETTAGTGTTFFIRLPIASADLNKKAAA